jgi:hypothetical protein
LQQLELHVLGLVFNVLEVLHRIMRLAADSAALQTRYPINFVVKHRRPLEYRESRALRLMKPVRRYPFPAANLFLGCRHVFVAAIRKQ